MLQLSLLMFSSFLAHFRLSTAAVALLEMILTLEATTCGLVVSSVIVF